MLSTRITGGVPSIQPTHKNVNTGRRQDRFVGRCLYCQGNGEIFENGAKKKCKCRTKHPVPQIPVPFGGFLLDIKV